MIQDPKRLTDGFRGLPDGMDGSRLPPLVPPTSVWYAENVTFRDGLGAKTRPGFAEIPSSFWRPSIRGDLGVLENTVTGFELPEDNVLINGLNTTSASRYATWVKGGNFFQGAYFYNDPRFGNPAQIVVVIDGVVLALNFAERSCFILNQTGGVIQPLNPTLPVYMTQAERFLIIQNGVDTPQVYDGYSLRSATSFGDGVNVIPVGKQMAYGQGRLFVANNDGTQITAGDLIYGGSTSSVAISSINPPSYSVTCSIAAPTTKAVASISISGTTCTLTGTGFPFAVGASVIVSSSSSADSTNAALGQFTTATGTNSTTIVFQVPANTPLPTGTLTVQAATTTATLTGVGMSALTAGQTILVTSDNANDSTNSAIGSFLSVTASATSVTYTVPSTSTVPIGALTLYFGLPGYVTVTTKTAHGFSANSVVTIQGTTSSVALNGTFVVQSVPSTTSFTITVDNYAYGTGTGGTVSLANAGQDTDLLCFTETTFIAEGGPLAVPADLGQVSSMGFVPLQDSATGQGDLVVLCSRGASSLAVSADRSLWSSTPGFQRVLYSNIGCVGDSTVLVNGDLFFRSLDGNGIRSYRSARAEFSGYGQVPMSAEIDPILQQDTPWLLSRLSFINHNDRLLMTCWPAQSPTVNGDPNALEALPVCYSGIAALDFRSVANGHFAATAKPAFDGVWTGYNVLKLLAGIDSGKKRAFFFALDRSGSTPQIRLWEILEDQKTDVGESGAVPVSSTLITRAYSFNEPMALKKLLRLDLWFNSIWGGPNQSLSGSVSYRPDDWPTWVPWASISRTFNTETVTSTGTFSSYPYLTEGYAPQLRFPAPSFPATATDATANTMSGKPTTLGYDFNFKLQWTGHARLGRLLLHALEIIEPVGGGSL